MPSTSQAVHDLMKKWFPEIEDLYGLDGAAFRFLEVRGWTDKAGLLIPPTPSHRCSIYELQCIRYLCEEWDYAWEGMWGWNVDEFIARELEK